MRGPYDTPEKRKAHSEYNKKWRLAHPEVYRRIRANRRQRMKDHVRKQKDRPCADCKKRYPYYVMDFDHRPNEEKSFEIGDRLATRVTSTYDALDAEIAKCDVVCANCHRIRTHQRQSAKGVPEDKPTLH
jgi:hypothetical protein